MYFSSLPPPPPPPPSLLSNEFVVDHGAFVFPGPPFWHSLFACYLFISINHPRPKTKSKPERLPHVYTAGCHTSLLCFDCPVHCFTNHWMYHNAFKTVHIISVKMQKTRPWHALNFVMEINTCCHVLRWLWPGAPSLCDSISTHWWLPSVSKGNGVLHLVRWTVDICCGCTGLCEIGSCVDTCCTLGSSCGGRCDRTSLKPLSLEDSLSSR